MTDGFTYPTGYKGSTPEAAEHRVALAKELLGRRTRLGMSTEQLRAIHASDHHFDALVCALIARAAELGETASLPENMADRARREGWISLPTPESLGRLGGR
jgi:Protein of unknown function (DUF429)